jgi:hydroxymethylbilane synthase
VIGSRGSALALWQTAWAKTRLEQQHRIAVRMEVIQTTGDKIRDVPLAQAGGTKALFTKEIEDALLAHRVDLAVHSMKDVPTELPRGLAIAAVGEREDPRDAWISRSGAKLEEIPSGARVGTSSLRRTCQLRHVRPDLDIQPLRGNLDTRLRKLDEGQFDAIVLAAAGLKRLGLLSRATELLSPERVIPAIGQGALAIEIRSEDTRAKELVSCLDHRPTHLATLAERSLLKRLGGGCQVPVAAHAVIEGETLRLVALVASVDGTQIVRASGSGPLATAPEIGLAVAEELLHRGADKILKAIYAHSSLAPPAAG